MTHPIRRALSTLALLAAGTAAGSIAGNTAALADTTDVTWQSRVVLDKQGDHCVDDPNCFNRYHPAIEPAAEASRWNISTVSRE